MHTTASCIHDACGVSGLHILLKGFTEDVERRLFKHDHFAPEADAHAAGVKTGRLRPLDPHGESVPDIHRLCNAVRDSGLFPDLVEPECAPAQIC